MSPAALEIFAEAYFDCFNTRQWGRLAEFYAPLCELQDPILGRQKLQAKALVGRFEDLCRLVPNLRNEILNLYPLAPNRIALELRAKGRLISGQDFEQAVALFFELEDKQIVSERVYYYALGD